ncbi:methyltransferase domain-containing protein [Rhabdaerophilum sp. SD176]|uniref:methyltransferase domain-containing protein n=1 Tax=Rhabdaerophilum sp. SD176 TaxID=2983548 RepID=UPI0024DF6764|nr:methyltransferase domain-containing protein [Rhabdaerophilum sp. SD176]
MATSVPELFDPVKAGLALARARSLGAETFLLERSAGDLVDRLAPVLREFDSGLDLGTPGGFLAGWLAREGRARNLATASPEALLDDGEVPGDLPLVVSAHAFHRVNDLPGLLARIRALLKPDGLLVATFPGGDTLHELRECLIAAESEIRGAAGLRVFPMVDVRSAGQLLQRAGFALPVADLDRVTLRYATMFDLVRDLRAMGATALPLLRPGQPPLTRAILLRAAALYAERFTDPDGRLRATFDFIWISGWTPHESQQKPARRGSGSMRLEEALERIRAQDAPE